MLRYGTVGTKQEIRELSSRRKFNVLVDLIGLVHILCNDVALREDARSFSSLPITFGSTNRSSMRFWQHENNLAARRSR